MKAKIAKWFTFDAAHWLPNVPDGHKCKRMHGHTYEVEFVLHGTIRDGFVVDYADIEMAWLPIFDMIDHRVLNDVQGLGVPSTENLCAWMFDRLIDDKRPAVQALCQVLTAIRIRESSSTWCEITARDYAASAGEPGRR